MGKLVNVVRTDGKVVAIPEEDAARLSGAGIAQPETDQAAAARVVGAKNEERSSGFVQGVKTVAEGGLDAASGGLFGKVAGALSPDYAEDLANRGTNRPGLRMLGEAAAIVLPGGVPGMARGAGEAITGATGSALAGRVAEGAIIGAGGHVATTNVTGDPLTIEGTMIGMGLGSFLNVGLGAAADKVRRAGDKALTVGEEVAAQKADVTIVKRGRELFSKNPDGWDGFHEAVKSAVGDQQKVLKQVERATKAYNDFVGGNERLNKEITKTSLSINKISKYWRDGIEEVDKLGAKAKAPISDDMKATLQSWRDRMRRIDQLRTGGFDVDAAKAGKQWVKAEVAPNRAQALEELRALRTEMEQGVVVNGKRLGPFPQATRTSNWKDLPAPPPKDVIPVETVKIPKSLQELARMEPASIERLSNTVASNEAANTAFAKINEQLGTDAADSVAGLHSKLGKYIGAHERLMKIAAKAEDGGDGFLAMMRRGAKKFIRYGSARAADSALGGKWLGSAGRVFAGEGAGMAMDATEDLLSGAMMQGKLGVRQAVSTVVSKMSAPTARVLKELGPVTAYLQNRLFTNEEEAGDHDELAVKRIGEAFAAAGSAPDAAYIAVQSLLGHPSDAALKLQQKAVGDVSYLAQTAPKDPGIAMHGLKSEWKPSPDEAYSFAHRIEAVVDPLKAIARTIAGDGHPAGIETLWARWPALMQTAAEEFVFALHDGEMSRDTASNYSLLFRTPITGLQHPEVLLTLQGLYLPKPEEGARPQVDSSGRPAGRPAAYDSQVAGSSVSGLLSQ